MAGIAAFGRLVGAGWRLARHDALLPREFEPLYPPALLSAGRLLRLFAGGKARAGRPGERLALALEGLGPVAIKLGQLLSTRGDIFGAEFAEDLSHLKDRLPPFPTAIARAEIERELGKPVAAIFARFGEPVGAASLAQAHDAEMPDGRRVAVKVLRPGVEQRVLADSEALRLAAAMIEDHVPLARRLEPRAFADTVMRATLMELDLRMEAAGADELREVMAADGYMQAPRVVWEAAGKRVLALEWAPGMPLSDPASLDQPGLDRKALANKVIRGFLAQAMDHGVFHADLHEGNLFVAAPDTLTAVDFGIIGRLGKAERRYLAEILWGFLQRDYMRVAQVHFDAGYVPAGQDVAAFAQALRAVGEPVFGRPASEVSMGRLLTQLFEITALFEMRLQPQLVLLQKTQLTVEGVARRIDPDHDIWAASDPVVRRWIARELSPKATVERLLGEGLTVLRRLAEPPPAVMLAPQARQPSRIAWFLGGASLAGLAAWGVALLT